jgi:hypothetical protein
MKALDEKRNCATHGYTLFRHRKNAKGQWWVCHLCLKEQWRKSQLIRRKKPGVQEYQNNFNKELNQIRKSLSVYLAMILIAADIKPE